MNAHHPSEEEAWRDIVFRLENDPAFWFGLIAGDDRRPRKRLRDRAEAWCKAHDLPFFEHTRAPGELRLIAVELSRNPQSGLHWIHADGADGLVSEWDAGAKAMLMAMNERRDAYRRHLTGGVVVAGRTTLKPILRDFAPDMFSIRAFVAEPGSNPVLPVPVPVRPELYFFIPDQIPAESAEGLLARAERLTGIPDPDAERLRAQAIVAAIVQLLTAERWTEAEAVAERFTREEELSPGCAPEWRREASLLARVLSGVVGAEVHGPAEVLARAHTMMAELGTLGRKDFTLVDVSSLVTLRLAELHALQQLQRWEDAAASLANLAGLVGEIAPTFPMPLLSMALPAMFRSCHRTAAQLRAQGKADAATATVDGMIAFADHAHATAPGDPRWILERARILLLRADDLMTRRDFATALATADELLALADEHADTGVEHWLVVRRGARMSRVAALVSMQDWRTAADDARGLLDEIGESSAQGEADPWLKVYAAIWRAHALEQLQGAEDLAFAVDEALHAAASALATGEGGEFADGTGRLLTLLWSAFLQSSQDLAPSSIQTFFKRLRLTVRVLGAALARWPTESRRAALSSALATQLSVALPYRGNRHSPWSSSRRGYTRLRRRARAINRWREGKRLPPFVNRYAKQLGHS